MRSFNTFALLVAAFTVTGPMAHVLELPNKLALNGALWLPIQQQLYHGWGVLFGPVEIVALLAVALLAFARRQSIYPFRLTMTATIAYALMIGVFFIFNAPVNALVAGWTPDTLPPDWTHYRLQWEIGHALAALLALIALTALITARLREIALLRD